MPVRGHEPRAHPRGLHSRLHRREDHGRRSAQRRAHGLRGKQKTSRATLLDRNSDSCSIFHLCLAFLLPRCCMHIRMVCPCSKKDVMIMLQSKYRQSASRHRTHQSILFVWCILMSGFSPFCFDRFCPRLFFLSLCILPTLTCVSERAERERRGGAGGDRTHRRRERCRPQQRAGELNVL